MIREIPNPLKETSKMYYRDGYRYQLAETFIIEVNFKPNETIITEYGMFTESGFVIIWQGYAWDGASGPTADTLNSMRSALIHDFFYQLMREDKLSRKFRILVDKFFFKILRRDGMSWLRAKYWYQSVRIVGYSSTESKSCKKMLVAP